MKWASARPAVGCMVWLGLDDALAVNFVNRKLPNQKAKKHAEEKHKHPEAGLGRRSQAKRSAESHSARETTRQEKALERIVPTRGPRPSPKNGKHEGAKNGVRIRVPKFVRLHLRIACPH